MITAIFSRAKHRIQIFDARALIYTTTPWAIAALATGLLMVLHPFKGQLDRGSVFAIVALLLATAAVTVGLVSVLAQHLSETYARSVVTPLLSRSTWLIVAVCEGLGVGALVALTLWRTDMSTGAAAGFVLAASLSTSWAAVLQLFKHFDPVSLIRLQRDDALRRLQHEGGTATAARQPSESILSLIVTGGAKSDIDVVTAGFSAWNDILARYLQMNALVYYDEYISWLYARSQELVERHAKDSVGLILPTVVEGVTALGKTAGAYRNPLNAELDEGSYLLCETLKHVVELSGTDRRSPAANLAADGIAGIGKACVAAEKFAVLTTPVKTLIAIGAATAEPLPYTSRIASAGLAELLFRLAESHSLDVMRHANAEDIAEGLHKIIGHERGGLGPGHGLVAPMSQFSLPRLCQALAAAPAEDEDYHRRQWDNLVLSLAGLHREIFNHPRPDSSQRMYTVEAAATTILCLLTIGQREELIRAITELSALLIDAALAERQPMHAEDALAAACLTTYYASVSAAGAEARLRAVSVSAANRIREAEPQVRRRLSPILRRVGATALRFNDAEMARIMAESVGAEPMSPYPRKSIGGDPFDLGTGGHTHVGLGRPGVNMVDVPTSFQDPELQGRLLQMEAELHPPPAASE